jgi:hypothetical protein
LRRFFLTIVTISQLFGALFAFSYFDETLKQTPLSTLGPMQQLATLGTVVIYLLGLVGSILIWLSRRAGLWLSLLHELIIIPVFFIAGVFYWVMGDGFAVAAVAWRTALPPASRWPSISARTASCRRSARRTARAITA